MLADLEKKTAALLAGTMSGRAHVSVVAAPGPPAPANDGLEVMMVSIAEASSAGEFQADRFVSQVSPPQSRRVLPLSIVVGIDVAIKPANSAAGLAAARTLLLEDVSLASHYLAGDSILSGTDFTIANPDPGFRVKACRLSRQVLGRDAVAGLLTARIECVADVEIWPPDPVSQEGVIGGLRTLILPQPLDILPRQPVVAMGGTLRLKVHGLAAARKQAAPAESLAISVTVLSDVPPGQRGTVANGVAGAETGARVVTVAGPSTDIQYAAPANGIQGMRIEFLSIHAATPAGKAGVFLGSVAIRVTGGN